MPIKGSDLKADIKVVRHKPSGRIKPDTGHDKYNDWHEDDTHRDPTPANHRRTEQFTQTHPKPGDGPDSEGKISSKGTKSQEFFVGLPEGE